MKPVLHIACLTLSGSKVEVVREEDGIGLKVDELHEEHTWMNPREVDLLIAALLVAKGEG